MTQHMVLASTGTGQTHIELVDGLYVITTTQYLAIRTPQGGYTDAIYVERTRDQKAAWKYARAWARILSGERCSGCAVGVLAPEKHTCPGYVAIEFVR